MLVLTRASVNSTRDALYRVYNELMEILYCAHNDIRQGAHDDITISDQDDKGGLWGAMATRRYMSAFDW